MTCSRFRLCFFLPPPLEPIEVDWDTVRGEFERDMDQLLEDLGAEPRDEEAVENGGAMYEWPVREPTSPVRADAPNPDQLVQQGNDDPHSSSDDDNYII